MADRAAMAAFLRARREALQPEDVGLPRGRRRRTGGLRREEVAALCDMSADYYRRLEQTRGPHPSERMLAAIARGLHLSLEERDHLFRLAGHALPARARRGDHINPGMMRILDRLEDTPAQVMNHLGETLKQTRPAVALLGDETRYTGFSRSSHYRWFTDAAARLVHPVSDHVEQSRLRVADLHDAYTRDGRDSRAGELVHALRKESPEFAGLWRERPVLDQHCAPVRFQHPQVGSLELHCQTLVDPDQSQRLLVYTAVPGTASHTNLALLSVLGQSLQFEES
ncbi:helix-turn-helix transcriptional regulator [Streptomyces sp. MMS20-AI2-20]|uniref:helix-turn-helix transcriptional regulator n=1 Tax=Streptomyces TaxID=1883 RepID=UPI001F60ED7A|nr:helix-turn-helix transcriptional regulator [Streptomyces sp. MMS20-AI2-20]MCI4146644.1 helix-turn-helix transcriptional regulator [Streptomyces sp. MMS20-AI2-20]